MIETINIEKIILHILDPSVGLAVLSQEEHPDSGETIEFLDGHIENSIVSPLSGCSSWDKTEIGRAHV